MIIPLKFSCSSSQSCQCRNEQQLIWVMLVLSNIHSSNRIHVMGSSNVKIDIWFWRLSILLFTHESVFKMSALRPHTCLFRTLIRLKSHKSYSRTFCAKFKREDTVFFNLPKQCFVPLLNVPCSCKYSKQTGSLTDDILKTRVVQDIPKEQKQKDESKKKINN